MLPIVRVPNHYLPPASSALLGQAPRTPIEALPLVPTPSVNSDISRAYIESPHLTSYTRSNRRWLTVLDAFLSIHLGLRVRDRLAILANITLMLTYPVGILARRVNHPLPYPLRIPYVLRLSSGTLHAPGGLHFLQAASHIDSPITQVINELVSGTFVDVGASVGLYTLQAAQKLGARGRVFSFEPAPDRFKSLQRNILTNRLSNVTARCCAVGAIDGEAYLLDLTCGPNPRDISVATDAHMVRPAHARRIPIQRLDSLIQADEPVALVKVDVEGAESEVFLGMTTILDTCRPIIVFEALSATAARVCSEILSKHGYEVSGSAPGDLVARPAQIDVP